MMTPPRHPARAASAAAPPAETLSSADAARELGVKTQTLYAYVSRGLLTSVADPAHPSARRYPAVEVRRLKAYVAARRDPAGAARSAVRGALAWGEPVLESEVTLIANDRFFYRGHDAVRLAEEASFEAVAELLWLRTPPSKAVRWDVAPGVAETAARAALDAWKAAGTRAFDPLAVGEVALPIAAALDRVPEDPSPIAVAAIGRRIADLLTRIACGESGGPPGGIAERLAAAWAPGLPGAARLFEAALVLTADHELNAAAFAARVVASTDGSPYASVAAGLAALSGARHGGETIRVAAMLDEIAGAVDPAGDDRGRSAPLHRSMSGGSGDSGRFTSSGIDRFESSSGHDPRPPDRRAEPGDDGDAGGSAGRRSGTGSTSDRNADADQPADALDRAPADANPYAAAAEELVARRTRRRERISGFGHRLYPNGDPRAAKLLAMARALAEGTSGSGDDAAHAHARRELALAEAVAAEVTARTGRLPTVDFALVTVGRATGAPAYAPIALFAIGRSAGLVAQTIEQYAMRRVLRPRAHYIGPPPEDRPSARKR